jgi:pimeloyl-ACP methyl ester carboxylesterase
MKLRMRSRVIVALAALILASGSIAAGVVVRQAHAASLTTKTGTLSDGATYLIEVPGNWNGTLLLYSHGYVVPGTSNPARDVGDPITRGALLAQGYALAGSSYATTGWAVGAALQDQMDVLDAFDQTYGTPTRTIAWGHSLGGIITAGLIQQHPDRFAGALPMCGVIAGSVGTWNQALDGAFALKTLLAPNSALQLVHITNPNANLGLAEQVLGAAQQTPQGQARLALAAALADLPGWFSPVSPEPDSTDYATQEANQFIWLTQVDAPFEFAFRLDLELKTGGNPSWNVGVNYEKQLENSVDLSEVQALYQAAGLNLNDDLAVLQAAPRIAADPGAVSNLAQDIVFNGQPGVPVLTMHTTGDGLVVNEDEQAYASVVRSQGNNPLLREVFVHRAGHCAFSPAETLTALGTLVHRLDTGKWAGATDTTLLNQEAAGLGTQDNVIFVGGQVVPAAPAFLDFAPANFLRPFDAGDVAP